MNTSAFLLTRTERMRSVERMEHPVLFTPGPYESGLSCEGTLCIYTSDTPERVGGDPIAVVLKEVAGHPMPQEANARLLSASNVMYDALTRIEAALDLGEAIIKANDEAALRNALASVRGRVTE